MHSGKSIIQYKHIVLIVQTCVIKKLAKGYLKTYITLCKYKWIETQLFQINAEQPINKYVDSTTWLFQHMTVRQ